MRVRFIPSVAVVADALSCCSTVSTTCADFSTARPHEKTEMAQGWIKNNADEIKGLPFFAMKSQREQEDYVISSPTECGSDNPDKDLRSLVPIWYLTCAVTTHLEKGEIRND